MKESYIQPTIKMTAMLPQTILDNSVTDVESGDTDIDLGGGGTVPGRAPGNNIWESNNVWDEE